ncbi:hypothetical protein WJ74_24170 [Burkholderia ubonensis]|nr:hypothetical protein WJ74_24170 [Burkholderia ubonensis]
MTVREAFAREQPLLLTLADANEKIERWWVEYNESRPHRALGETPPAEFARQLGVYAQLTGLQKAED